MLLCIQDIKRDSKKGARLSIKHSAVVDWINTAHLTFPLAKYPLHVTLPALLSREVKFVGNPSVWCIIANLKLFIAIITESHRQSYLLCCANDENTILC